MCLDGPGKSSAVVQSISCSMGTGALQLSKCLPLVLVIEAVFSSGEPCAVEKEIGCNREKSKGWQSIPGHLECEVSAPPLS